MGKRIAERSARLRRPGASDRHLSRRTVTSVAMCGLSVVMALGLLLKVATDSRRAETEQGERAVDALRTIGRQIHAADVRFGRPAALAAVRSAYGAGKPRRDPLPHLLRPFPAPGSSASSDPGWLAEVEVEEIEILGIYGTSRGALARARSPRHDGVLVIGAGDRLGDGEVAWVGFLSHRLAAVRLKQRPWPPRCWPSPERGSPETCDGKPYREVLRVLGWDALHEPASPASPGLPDAFGVVGREGLGAWPDGRYSNTREVLVEHVGGERLPRVDLFAAAFHEIYGLLPWQHEAWSPAGWTVEAGFPLRGAIVELEQAPAGTRRPDPFRSLLEPWNLIWPHRPPRQPRGIAGLLIDDVELEEIYMTAHGPVAEIGTFGSLRPWILRPGDQLWDGSVTSIDMTSVTYKQTVSDPTALKPFREVVRRLNPRRRF